MNATTKHDDSNTNNTETEETALVPYTGDHEFSDADFQSGKKLDLSQLPRVGQVRAKSVLDDILATLWLGYAYEAIFCDIAPEPDDGIEGKDLATRVGKRAGVSRRWVYHAANLWRGYRCAKGWTVRPKKVWKAPNLDMELIQGWVDVHEAVMTIITEVGCDSEGRLSKYAKKDKSKNKGPTPIRPDKAEYALRRIELGIQAIDPSRTYYQYKWHRDGLEDLKNRLTDLATQVEEVLAKIDTEADSNSEE